MKNTRYSGKKFVLTKKSSWSLVVFLAGILISCVGLLPAQLINVDFNQNNGVGWGGGGPNPGPTMSGAAVLGTAGDHWNGINVNSGSGISLNYADAAPRRLKWLSHPAADTTRTVTAVQLLLPILPTMPWWKTISHSGSIQTISLSGLAPNAIYNLVLYNAANSSAGGRTTYFTVNGILKAALGMVPAAPNRRVDYVNFSSAMSDGSGNLGIAYSGNGTAEGDLDGFQIQAALSRLVRHITAPMWSFHF